MKTKTSQAFRGFRGFLAGCLVVLTVHCAFANPQGMTVTRGTATTTASGSKLNVQVSQGAMLNWQSFNIQPGETTTFVQPSKTSVVWNKILDPNLSKVWGNLNANGWVVLMNQNGFYFGPNSVINVGGMMVTTVPVGREPSADGGFWQFNGAPPLASIVCYGEVKAQAGGSVFLIADKVENHGTISAPGGKIGLYAGKELLVSERPDGRGISATVKLPAGSVDNTGKLIADAGTIALSARVVNDNGMIQANSVRERNGVIELVASDSVNLGAEALLQAQGDKVGLSPGGSITIKSDRAFADAAGSRLDVSGGAAGGNGGTVEISAPNIPSIQSRLEGSAKAGFKGGSLLLDPTDIFLSNDGTDSAGSGTVPAGANPDTLRLNVNSAFVGFAQIRLEATRDISLDPFTVWNLNDSTGISTSGSLLTLEAGRNIVFGDNSRLVGGAGWSVRLAAGVDFSTAQHSVRNGVGGIYLNGGPADAGGNLPGGSGSLETSDGSISLSAGHEVLVDAGYIRTVGGGSIDITTGDGNVDAGTRSDHYIFQQNRYDLSSDLSGIGTAHGGNVTIHSGGDILSFNSTLGAYSGLGLNEAGDVTLTAAGSIKGKFHVSDGQGSLQAGVDVGSSSSPITLSLIKGGWDARTPGDIYIDEVLNPNGVFNNNRVGGVRYRFDYDPLASVYLQGNSVQLLGNALAYDRQGINRDRAAIYAPRLVIDAGAGGVVLGNDLVLYPSALGTLQVTTHDGGSLRSTPGNYYQLIVSDSGSADYKTFAAGHAAVPLHFHDPDPDHPDPVSLVIAGNWENVFLRSPKRADISIGGNALNFGFEGQNLGDEVTRIAVAGSYFSRSDRTFAGLGDLPPESLFEHIFVDPFYSANPDVAAKLTYNPLTHTLGFQGRMTANDRDFLLHPYVLTLDQNGFQVLDSNGNPVYTPATFTGDASAINALYANSQDIPASSLAYSGIQIGGPGSLSVTAAGMDLGISHGIRSVGTLLNNSLQTVSLQGAALTLEVAGDLKMTSSQIASFNGGNITVTTTHGGGMNIGSQEQFTSDDTPKGIYTANGGDVTIVSEGNIDINGSRIATYDGGNVKVTVPPKEGEVIPEGGFSADGDINAGGGARGFFTVTTEQVNPLTGNLELRNDRFFGSGIVALTRQDSDAQVGNISVSARRDILASAGGILQLAFNHSDLSQAHLDLTAGRDIVANQSGVLGANLTLNAGRDIIGLVVGSGNVNLTAIQNVTANVLGGGNVSVTGGQSVSGSIAGGGQVGVSGSEITASITSTAGSTSTSGDASGAKVGAFQGAAAPVAQVTTTEADKKTATAKTDDDEEEKKKKRAAAAPVVSKTVGRVTVILPAKP